MPGWHPHPDVQADCAGSISNIDAAIEAAHLRLRPILITGFTFISGAEMRQALGTAVFFGIFLPRSSFTVIRKLTGRVKLS